MTTIKILDNRFDIVMKVKENNIFIDVKDGIQCICKRKTDYVEIIYTIPSNYIICKIEEDESET